MRKQALSRKSLCLISSLLALAISGCGVMEKEQSNTLPTGTIAADVDTLPFYRWDADVPKKPGTILRKEAVDNDENMDGAGETYRILYTSTDVRWNSGQVPVSGTLFLPKGEAPEGGWPLLAWAHGTVGISDVCAPSLTGFRLRDSTYMNQWLKKGYAVVATDYQGFGGPGPHPYLYWQAEARSVLDSVRAAQVFEPVRLSRDVLVAGQSQGSGAALGAATIFGEYAPELNVKGAVVTGLVSSFPDGPVPMPVRNSANMFLSFASGGLQDGGKTIDEILTEDGLALLATARTACTNDIKKHAYKLRLRDLSLVFTIPMAELGAIRIVVTDMPMEGVTVPVMVATGLSDATIKPERQYAAVKALCAAGTNVKWMQYEGHGHDGAMNGSLPAAFEFASAILNGDEPAGNCDAVTMPEPPGELRKDIPFNDD